MRYFIPGGGPLACASLLVLILAGSASARQEASPVLARAEEAARKAAAEAAEAGRRLQEAQAADKAAAGQLAAAKQASEAAAKDSGADSAEARAAKAALASAEEALRKSAAALKAAVQDCTTKDLAARKAAEKTQAEKVFIAWTVLARTRADRAKAEKALADRLTAARRSGDAPGDAAAQLERALSDARKAERAAKGAYRREEARVLGGLKPLPEERWTLETARHLLFRAGFGGTLADVERLHAMGLYDAVDHLVDWREQPEPAPAFEAAPYERALAYEALLEPGERARMDQARGDRHRSQINELRKDWVRRMCESARPLQEKLALFWHSHFATNYADLENVQLIQRQNEAFRGRTADNFGTLLRAIVHDPAMIRYLDNHKNFKKSGNENFGREILELFTMGEGQGYSEEDLREASRCLTGYSFDNASGLFKFLASKHDETPKKVFGKQGAWGGDDLVDLILQQPQPAEFIGAKLFRYFAHESPDALVVGTLANVLRKSNYELAPLLRTLFLSEEFYGERSAGGHIMNPAELIVGTVRMLGLRNVDHASVDRALQGMGQTLFEPPNVRGWEEGPAWIDATRILARYNGVSKFIERSELELTDVLAGRGVCGTEAVVDHLIRTCLSRPPSAAKRQKLIETLGVLPPAAEWPAMKSDLTRRLKAVLILITSMPEFQVT